MQTYQTPPEFITAVKRKFRIHKFVIDLAASAENTQATRYWTEQDNAFQHEWSFYDENRQCINWGMGSGFAWCNPPFGDLRPWVEKASLAYANILMLVPASVGANWWAEHVHRQANVYFLNGRISFVGTGGPFPRDLALLEYNPDIDPEYYVWRWK